MNENWQRWIYASIAKHFADIFTAKKLSFLVESAPQTSDKFTDWAEIRMTGPDWIGGTNGEWIAERVEISILVQSKLSQKNSYILQTNIGIVCNAYSVSIPVFRLGDGQEDDEAYLTCLQLKAKGRDAVKVNQLGKVSASTQLLRATVDADYFGNFREE